MSKCEYSMHQFGPFDAEGKRHCKICRHVHDAKTSFLAERRAKHRSYLLNVILVIALLLVVFT